MTPCPCLCGGAVKVGNTYASKQCGKRAAARRRRNLIPAVEPKMCAWCHVHPVKSRGKKYCDRTCGGWAAAAARTPAQLQASGQRLTRYNRRKYWAKVKADIDAICRAQAIHVSPEVFRIIFRVSLRVWAKGYKSGNRTASMRRQRERKEAA